MASASFSDSMRNPLAGPFRGSLGEPSQANGDRQVLPFSMITNPSQVLSFSMSVYNHQRVERDLVSVQIQPTYHRHEGPP